jgi:hypothetical protein
MTYKSSFICTSLYLSRHKVSKLLIAALAGENFTFEVVIVDSHCPNANFGGGAFGQKLLSVKSSHILGSITNCIYR